MGKEKTKRVPAHYMVEFVTALPLFDCIERLERPTVLRDRAATHPLAPIKQKVQVQENNVFRVERDFPGALHPIRLMGRLDPDPEGGSGTRVQASITHDTQNQVLIEGMLLFLGFFVLTVLLLLRLRLRAMVITLPMLLLMWWLLSMRWRALRVATEDLARWVRRRLYVTKSQVR